MLRSNENGKGKEVKELKEEIGLLDDMLSVLVELLEEKGVLKYEEWEKKIKEKANWQVSLYLYLQHVYRFWVVLKLLCHSNC